jgi:hypothetical protein
MSFSTSSIRMATGAPGFAAHAGFNAVRASSILISHARN